MSRRHALRRTETVERVLDAMLLVGLIIGTAVLTLALACPH